MSASSKEALSVTIVVLNVTALCVVAWMLVQEFMRQSLSNGERQAEVVASTRNIELAEVKAELTNVLRKTKRIDVLGDHGESASFAVSGYQVRVASSISSRPQGPSPLCESIFIVTLNRTSFSFLYRHRL